MLILVLYFLVMATLPIYMFFDSRKRGRMGWPWLLLGVLLVLLFSRQYLAEISDYDRMFGLKISGLVGTAAGIWIGGFIVYRLLLFITEKLRRKPETNSMAHLGLVMGLLSIVLFPLILPPMLAVAFAIIGLIEVRRDPQQGGRTRAIVGLILGGVFFYVAATGPNFLNWVW